MTAAYVCVFICTPIGKCGALSCVRLADGAQFRCLRWSIRFSLQPLILAKKICITFRTFLTLEVAQIHFPWRASLSEGRNETRTSSYVVANLIHVDPTG